jgi:hypothetical protein
MKKCKKNYLWNADLPVVHEVKDTLEFFLVNALQVEERVLVVVARQDPTE